jgi:hypothetical protein
MYDDHSRVTHPIPTHSPGDVMSISGVRHFWNSAIDRAVALLILGCELDASKRFHLINEYRLSNGAIAQR